MYLYKMITRNGSAGVIRGGKTFFSTTEEFFIVLFSLKALLVVISIYLIIRYKREYDKKRSEEIRLEEEKRRMEMEERERMVEKTLN